MQLTTNDGPCKVVQQDFGYQAQKIVTHFKFCIVVVTIFFLCQMPPIIPQPAMRQRSIKLLPV